METDINTTTRETKEQMGNYIRNDMKKLKLNNWTNRIQVRNKWKLYVERSKSSKIEVVAPKEEDTRRSSTQSNK